MILPDTDVVSRIPSTGTNTQVQNAYSIVVPAYNEEKGIGDLLESFSKLGTARTFEIIVVDDSSTDATVAIASKYGVQIVKNISNFGYGYSLKRGIRRARHENIIIMDADGSYPVSALNVLIERYEKGFDMVVGARSGAYYHGSTLKRVARFFFRVLSEFTTGRKIPDINSGFRIFRKDLALSFFETLSSGFSFTTTITLAFMLNAHSVSYVPIEYHKRSGVSKVRYLRDTLRSLQIIIEAIILYNPLKIFILCSIGILVVGCLSLIFSLLSIIIALIFFLAGASAILCLALGFLAVLFRFKLAAHNRILSNA